MLVDDFESGLLSRGEARAHVDALLRGEIPESMAGDRDESDPTAGLVPHTAEWYAARDAALRGTWGHDPEAQAQWPV